MPEAGSAEIVVALGVTRANLSGTLGAEDLLPDETDVVLESLGDGSIAVTKADKNGAFDFHNLPPGEYRAYAWSDLSRTEYRNPTFLARYKDKSKGDSAQVLRPWPDCLISSL